MATATAEALRKLAEALAPLLGEPQDGEPGDGDKGDKSDSKDATPQDGQGDESSDGGGDGEDASEGEGEPGEAKDSDSPAKPFGSYTGRGKPASEEPLPEKIKSLIRDDTPSEPKDRRGMPELLAVEVGDYTIYPPAKAKDRVVKAETLLGSHGPELRQELDELMPDNGIVSRLATKLMRHILADQTRAWEFDRDDGLLDPARLARIVSTPTLPIAYKQEREGKFKETAVTLLLDNSGSMGGPKIQLTAIIADILARVLERCGVSVEVLGFTTRGEVGGSKARGRTCVLEHIVYKQAAVPYRRTRENFGLMLDMSLSENIDGEALAWAYNRLIRRTEPRRILIVISDGVPLGPYMSDHEHPRVALDRHLRAIIAQIEGRGDVELLAIGALHDVTAYYKHAVHVRQLDQLGPVLMTELTKLFRKR